MASLFNSVVNIGKAAYDRLSAPTDPNLVKVLNPSELASIPTLDREGCLIFIGPKPAPKKAPPTFEVVAHSERNQHQSFSLFRTTDKIECLQRFEILKSIVPALLSIDPDACTQSYLQMMCDSLRGNPSLSLAHLAIELDLKNVYTNTVVSTDKYLNAVDSEGRTPLMVAIKKQNLYAVRHLIAKGAKKDVMDKKGNNVFHYLAMSNKDIVKEVTGEETSCGLNACNEDGQTPLHIACLNDQPDCVQALLCAGADVNVTGTSDQMTPMHTAIQSSNTRCVKEIIQMYPKQLHTQDIKYGGTPLHWAKSKEILEALLEAGCNIDAKNFQGDTALHLMAKYERLDCVLALVSYGAEINLKDSEGNTALHIACHIGNTSIVRALLVFDADTTITNNAGLNPWKVACEKTETGIFNSFDFKDRKGVLYSLFAVGAAGSEVADRNDFSKEQMKNSPLHKRTRTHFDELLGNAAKKAKGEKGPTQARLLCLDGGGIKGLVLVRMLRSMELIFGAPILHCFDWICGTSTGAILALAIASGKTAVECQALYFRLKDKVFIDTKPYNSKPFDELLSETFGPLKMYDIKHPKVTVTATMADRLPPDLHLFRTYKSPQETLGIQDFESSELPSPIACSPSDQLVWKAARASGAAPSFFRPEGKFVDGGIISNNPSLDLLTEISEYNVAQRAIGHEDQVVKPTILISLGTGVPPVRKANVVDIFRPESAQDTIKLLMNWDSMGKLMLESVLNTDGRVVDQTRSWCLSLGIPFYRMSPLLTTDVELDEKDDKILVDLMWNTMAYIYSRKEDILHIKTFLVL